MKIVMRILPLLLFGGLIALFWHGLSLNPHKLPSQLIDQPAPQLNLQELFEPSQLVTNEQMRGKAYLVHVWASWCQTCREEQPMLMDLAADGVAIIGIDYKDEAKTATKYLQKFGNPYRKVGFDANGAVAINWGVYGTPETFLVDKQGIIRYRQVGALTKDVWQTKFVPLIKNM